MDTVAMAVTAAVMIIQAKENTEALKIAVIRSGFFVSVATYINSLLVLLIVEKFIESG